MDHDVVEVVLHVVLHLTSRTGLQSSLACRRPFYPHPDDGVLEVGVDDLPRLLVEEGHQATQAQVLKTVQVDPLPEVALLHRGQVGHGASPPESCSSPRAAWRSPPPAAGERTQVAVRARQLHGQRPEVEQPGLDVVGLDLAG